MTRSVYLSDERSEGPLCDSDQSEKKILEPICLEFIPGFENWNCCESSFRKPEWKDEQIPCDRDSSPSRTARVYWRVLWCERKVKVRTSASNRFSISPSQNSVGGDRDETELFLFSLLHFRHIVVHFFSNDLDSMRVPFQAFSDKPRSFDSVSMARDFYFIGFPPPAPVTKVLSVYFSHSISDPSRAMSARTISNNFEQLSALSIEKFRVRTIASHARQRRVRARTIGIGKEVTGWGSKRAFYSLPRGSRYWKHIC